MQLRNHEIISKRAKSLSPSSTIQISSFARSLKKEGKDVIDLGIGEPDMPTPDIIKEAASSCALSGHKVYSDIRGRPELLEKIVESLKRDCGLKYNTNQVMGFDGGKVALDRVLETITGPGDEVILPLPAWVSYEPQITMAGAKVKPIYTLMKGRFKITPEQLESVISDKTKAIIICSPSNPTGIAYTSEELKSLARVLEKFSDIHIISDDLYQHLLFDGKFTNISMISSNLKERTIIVNGTTKSHTWRFGFLATENTDIINQMVNIQSHRSGHPNLETQAGAIKALEMGPLLERALILKHRHDNFFPKINSVPGWVTIPADGAFYFFVNITSSLHRLGLKSDVEYAMKLLNNAYVAVVPGSAFGCPNHIRISYCQSDIRLNQALEKITQFNEKRS